MLTSTRRWIGHMNHNSSGVIYGVLGPCIFTWILFLCRSLSWIGDFKITSQNIHLDEMMCRIHELLLFLCFFQSYLTLGFVHNYGIFVQILTLSTVEWLQNNLSELLTSVRLWVTITKNRKSVNIYRIIGS